MQKRFGIALGICALLGAAPAVALEEKGDTPILVAGSDADDTARNERDREGETLTPIDQGKSESDVEITRAIRRAVVAEKTFSTDARNVKIITRDGVVTLRGPVETSAEKTQIGSLAARPEGVKRVDNQIEVATQD